MSNSTESNFNPYMSNSNNNMRISNSMPSSYSSSPYMNSSNDRVFAGGFLGPFVLGGITGGLLAPAFYPRPYYPPRPYPYYGPYYR